MAPRVTTGMPVVNGMAHLAHQVFGNVNRKPATIVPAIQNVALMPLAGQTGRAVLAHAPTAPKTQRARNRRPQPYRLAPHPPDDIDRRFRLRANHL